MDEGLRRTPLYEEHLLLHARLMPFAGYEMPLEYSGIVEEHKAVRSSAGVFDICHMGEFRVFGFGAFDALQGLLTNDLGKIGDLGRAQYTLLLDEDGGIVDDMIIYHTGDLEYLLVVNAANRQTDWDFLVARCSDEIEAADESERTALIALQGPAALGVLCELAEDGFRVPDRFHIREARLDSIPALVARTGYTGEDGVELLCHASHAVSLWRTLLSFPEVTPCGLGARDTLRLEMGYRLHGQDMDRGVDPLSAGLGWIVAMEKGDFTGRAAIARISETGPARRLVGIRLDDGIPRPGYAVLREGNEVGKVASGTYSPTLGVGIGTAYVPFEVARPGVELQVVVRKKTVKATVVDPPFVTGTSLSAGKA